MSTFTAVLPFRGVPEEIAYAKETIPAIVDLGPSEVIVATDPITEKNRPALDAVRNAFGDYHTFCIRPFERNPDWNFHLASITHESIRMASADRILICNVDECPTPEAGPLGDLLGIARTAIVGGQAHPHKDDHYNAAAKYERRAPKSACTEGMIGTFWLYKPYYMEAINPADFSRVYDGSDGFIQDFFFNSDYRVLAQPDIVARLLAPGHMNLPGPAFLLGAYERICRRGWLRRLGIRTYLRASPSYRRGWRFAAIHWRHPLVRSMRGRRWAEVICHVRIRSADPLEYDSSLDLARCPGSQ